MPRRFAATIAIFLCAVSPRPDLLAADADTKPRFETRAVRFTKPLTPATSQIAIEMVKIPAGEITLRNSAGQALTHKVRPIWIGKYEVQWAEYDPWWMGTDTDDRRAAEVARNVSRPSKPYEDPTRNWGHDGMPAVGVHYRAAQIYCQWLSKETGKRFRLPTSAEWEYACRAGGPPVRLERPELEKVAWFDLNSEDHPHPVGKLKPNAWGLHDMLGNAAELVSEEPDNTNGIAAGGGWADELSNVHSGIREPFSYKRWQRNDPQEPQSRWWLDSGTYVGFRLVMEDDDAGAGARPTAAAPTAGKAEPKPLTIPVAAARDKVVPLEMVILPPGEVTLTDVVGRKVSSNIQGIAIGRYEITWDLYDPYWQWADFSDDLRRVERNLDRRPADRDAWSRPSDPYANPHREFGDAGYPAIGVHVRGAFKYCQWLSAKTGRRFRLPTEAEWEYACRAGGPPIAPATDAKALAEIAWFDGNAAGQPHKVGQLKPNAWGLYDMLGNAAEYVAVDPIYTGGARAMAAIEDAMRLGIVAGGSWRDDAKDVHSAARERYDRKWQAQDPVDPKSMWWLSSGTHVGFRVVMDLAPASDHMFDTTVIEGGGSTQSPK